MFDNFLITDDNDEIISEDRREYERHLWEYGLETAETTNNQDDLNDDERSQLLLAEEDETDDNYWVEQFQA